MSLFGSLFSGVSGLTAQSQAMGMISDNVSNVNTVSYKGAAPKFSTLVTRSAAVSTYSPGGVRANTSYRIDQQGLLQGSNSPTDAAIDGAGFFVVNSRPDGSGDQLYTRAGSFEQDFLGNLRNNAGFYLQGWALDANEQVDQHQPAEHGQRAGDQRRRRGHDQGRARRQPGRRQTPFAGAYAAGDLAAFNATGGVAGAQPHMVARGAGVRSARRRAQSSYGVPQGCGREHLERRSLCRPAPKSRRRATPTACSPAARSPSTATARLRRTNITPNYPAAVAGGPVGINWLDASGPDDSSITFDLGTVGDADGLSQFASHYNIAFVIQNGAEVGELNGVTIDQEGFVIASFTNGAHAEDLQTADRDLRQPAGARSAHRQRLRPDRGLGRVQSARRRRAAAPAWSRRRRSKAPMSTWPKSSPK